MLKGFQTLYRAFKRGKRVMALLVTVFFLAGISGCATPPGDNESDIPWNAPEPWEGTPYFPGLQGR